MTRAALFVLSLAACAPMPEVDAALGPDPVGSDYPEILPLAEVLARIPAAPATAGDAGDPSGDLLDRAAALRRRAAALGTP